MPKNPVPPIAASPAQRLDLSVSSPRGVAEAAPASAYYCNNLGTACFAGDE